MTYFNVDTDGSFVPKPVPITNRFTGSTGTAIDFNRVISDSAGYWSSAHPDVVCRVPLSSQGMIAHGMLKLRLEDFSTGTEFQVWQIEYDLSTWEIAEVDWSEEEYAPIEHDLLGRGDPAHDLSVKHYRFPVFAYVNPGHALAFRMTEFRDSLYRPADDPVAPGEPWRIGVIARASCALQVGPK